MLTILRASRDRAKGDPPSTYEAPKIETVLTPEDLEREVQYLALSRTLLNLGERGGPTF